MSLLQSHPRRAELSVSGRRRAGRQRAAAFVCLLGVVSCKFDSAPRTKERTSEASAGHATHADVARDASARSSQDAQSAAMVLEPDSGGDVMDAGDAHPSAPMAMAMVMTHEGSMMIEPKDAGASRAEPDASAPVDAGTMDSGSAEPADASAPRDAGREPDPRCREGIYAGTFGGSIQLIGLPLSTVTGTVRTTLRLNPDRTYLELRDARVVGTDQDGNRLTVDLSGNINCMTHVVQDGALTNGILHNVASSSDTAFTGEVQGMHSADPHSVVGTWTVTAEGLIPLLTGRGTWSLLLNEW